MDTVAAKAVPVAPGEQTFTIRVTVTFAVAEAR
jgi:uncharacterized protein YggE